MSYGALIKNADQETIIDSDHDSFVRTDTSTMSGGLRFGRYRFVLPTASTTVPSLFFIPINVGDEVAIDAFGGFFSNESEIIRNNNNNQIVVCKPASGATPPSNGFGMRIFKSDGSVSYSSELELGRIFSKESNITFQNSTTVNIDPRTTHVAIQLSSLRVVTFDINGNTQVVNSGVRRTSSTTAELTGISYIFGSSSQINLGIRLDEPTNFLFGRFV